jgi:D-proline reductase (dithiol) PrdB
MKGSLMEIVENLDAWQAEYERTWLAHYKETGEVNWKIYPKPTNTSAPSGKGIDLSQSRLILITTSGAYLKDSQEPYDSDDDLGDYSIRTFPMDTAFDALGYSHSHYDHTDVNKDPQVLLPLRHLEGFAAEGMIGELIPTVVSYMGYQPDAGRTVRELIPQVVDIALAEKAHAALLGPA